MWKKWIAAVLCTALAVLALSGCGKEQGDGGWAYIQDKGSLIVGLDDTFAPMGFRDENNELVGFDIDLARAVGEKLGVEIVFQPINWTAKEMELSSKKVDCVWNGMSATPERQESMALTDKYLNNRIVILSLDESVNVTSAQQLKDLKIGTQADSAALETMKASAEYPEFEGNISEYDTYDEAILDMQAGRLDCIVVDEVLGEYKNSKMEEKMTLSDFDFGDDFYAIGCRVEDKEVAAQITKAIGELIDDGTAAEISEKWFGRNIVILEGYDE